MLVAWMADNNSQGWSIGIKFVHFHKNTVYHAGFKCSPYSTMVAAEVQIGLTSTSPGEVIERLEGEDDLQALQNQQFTTGCLMMTQILLLLIILKPYSLLPVLDATQPIEMVPDNANLPTTTRETDPPSISSMPVVIEQRKEQIKKCHTC